MTRALLTRSAAVAASAFTLLVVGEGRLAVLAGVAGVVATAAGVLTGRQLPVTVGAVCLFAEVLFAGGAGVGPLFLVAGTVAAVAAWSFGGAAVELTDAFEPGADARSLEAVHVAGTVVLVGGTGAAVGLLSLVPLGSAPPVAALFFLLGGLVLATAVR